MGEVIEALRKAIEELVVDKDYICPICGNYLDKILSGTSSVYIKRCPNNHLVVSEEG